MKITENQKRVQALIKARLATLQPEERQLFQEEIKQLPPFKRAPFIAAWLKGEITITSQGELVTFVTTDNEILQDIESPAEANHQTITDLPIVEGSAHQHSREANFPSDEFELGEAIVELKVDPATSIRTQSGGHSPQAPSEPHHVIPVPESQKSDPIPKTEELEDVEATQQTNSSEIVQSENSPALGAWEDDLQLISESVSPLIRDTLKTPLIHFDMNSSAEYEASEDALAEYDDALDEISMGMSNLSDEVFDQAEVTMTQVDQADGISQLPDDALVSSEDESAHAEDSYASDDSFEETDPLVTEASADELSDDKHISLTTPDQPIEMDEDQRVQPIEAKWLFENESPTVCVEPPYRNPISSLTDLARHYERWRIGRSDDEIFEIGQLWWEGDHSDALHRYDFDHVVRFKSCSLPTISFEYCNVKSLIFEHCHFSGSLQLEGCQVEGTLSLEHCIIEDDLLLTLGELEASEDQQHIDQRSQVAEFLLFDVMIHCIHFSSMLIKHVSIEGAAITLACSSLQGSQIDVLTILDSKVKGDLHLNETSQVSFRQCDLSDLELNLTSTQVASPVGEFLGCILSNAGVSWKSSHGLLRFESCNFRPDTRDTLVSLPPSIRLTNSLLQSLEMIGCITYQADIAIEGVYLGELQLEIARGLDRQPHSSALTSSVLTLEHVTVGSIRPSLIETDKFILTDVEIKGEATSTEVHVPHMILIEASSLTNLHLHASETQQINKNDHTPTSSEGELFVVDSRLTSVHFIGFEWGVSQVNQSALELCALEHCRVLSSMLLSELSSSSLIHLAFLDMKEAELTLNGELGACLQVVDSSIGQLRLRDIQLEELFFLRVTAQLLIDSQASSTSVVSQLQLWRADQSAFTCENTTASQLSMNGRMTLTQLSLTDSSVHGPLMSDLIVQGKAEFLSCQLTDEALSLGYFTGDVLLDQCHIYGLGVLSKSRFFGNLHLNGCVLDHAKKLLAESRVEGRLNVDRPICRGLLDLSDLYLTHTFILHTWSIELPEVEVTDPRPRFMVDLSNLKAEGSIAVFLPSQDITFHEADTVTKTGVRLHLNFNHALIVSELDLGPLVIDDRLHNFMTTITISTRGLSAKLRQSSIFTEHLINRPHKLDYLSNDTLSSSPEKHSRLTRVSSLIEKAEWYDFNATQCARLGAEIDAMIFKERAAQNILKAASVRAPFLALIGRPLRWLLLDSYRGNGEISVIKLIFKLCFIGLCFFCIHRGLYPSTELELSLKSVIDGFIGPLDPLQRSITLHTIQWTSCLLLILLPFFRLRRDRKLLNMKHRLIRWVSR